jgi:hypothetical protein
MARRIAVNDNGVRVQGLEGKALLPYILGAYRQEDLP